ncbi:calponin homology domain-containing protein [Cladochytrium replicatum]|nr:calponin homology domain-containing protein [Cladochytrium replicatum]
MRDNATDIPVYGIDKELQAKAAAKYDPTREREAREWIEAVTGEKFRKEGFHESLKDGVLLVKLANRVINSNYKPNVSTMPFKQMENINNFLSALDKLGVPKTDCFQTVDLFENKNPNQVVDTIFAFSRHACKHGFDGPILGPKLADKREVQFSEEQLSQGKNIIGLQMGFTGGANASGVSYGGRRQIMDPKVG